MRLTLTSFVCLVFFTINELQLSAQIAGEEMPAFNSIQTYTEPTASCYWMVIGGTIIQQSSTSVQVKWDKNAFGVVEKWKYDADDYLLYSLDIIIKNTPATQFTYDMAGNRRFRSAIVLNSLKSGSINQEEFNSETDDENDQGIEEKTEGLILKIFPNPTEGNLAVVVKGVDQKKQSSIHVISSMGEKILKTDQVQEYNEISLESQPDGTYILVLVANNKVFEWKIIKQ